MTEDTQTATVIEVHATVTVPEVDGSVTLAEVAAMSLEFRAKLPKGSHFSIHTREVPIHQERRVQA